MLKPINQAFNNACLYIATRLFPLGFDVCANAPNSMQSLADSMNRLGRMAIWSGDHTRASCFADSEVWLQFRAWHDWIHYRFSCAFCMLGEHEACHIQAGQLRRLYGEGEDVAEMVALLFTTVIDPLEYAAAGQPIQVGLEHARANWRAWLPYARHVLATQGESDYAAKLFAADYLGFRAEHGPKIPSSPVTAHRAPTASDDYPPSMFA